MTGGKVEWARLVGVFYHSTYMGYFEQVTTSVCWPVCQRGRILGCVSHAACICDMPFTSDWIPEFEGVVARPYAMVLSKVLRMKK